MLNLGIVGGRLLEGDAFFFEARVPAVDVAGDEREDHICGSGMGASLPQCGAAFTEAEEAIGADSVDAAGALIEH